MASLPSKPISILIGVAVMLSVPLIAQFEGLRTDPYNDIVGVQTVCYGETRVAMRRYTKQECDAMLQKATEEFAGQVLKVTPILQYHPYQLSAATSFAYNIGIGAYKSSRTAALFNAGKFKEGCEAMMGWLKPKELYNRRNKERQLCLTGL